MGRLIHLSRIVEMDKDYDQAREKRRGDVQVDKSSVWTPVITGVPALMNHCPDLYKDGTEKRIRFMDWRSMKVILKERED